MLKTVLLQSAILSTPIDFYILLSAVLFTIGVVGVMYRRNAIVIFACVELMLNAVNLLLVAFSSYHSDASAQVFVFFIMAVAAAEVAVGLAILSMIYRNLKSIDIDVLSKLKH
ncbi:MAG TPA: NADH-quinone oxidoreductase subunit NuoK [Bacteroidia bacterium]